MQNVLIVGAGKGGTAILQLFSDIELLSVQKVADINSNAPGMIEARKNGIATYPSYMEAIDETIDIIVETTGDATVFQELRQMKPKNCVLIPGTVAHVIADLLYEKEGLMNQVENEVNMREILLSSIHDGMIVVDTNERITFVNQSAADILNQQETEMLGKKIREIIPDSALPNILQTKEKEINKQLILENGKKVITTRIPIIDDSNQLIGSFAVFKDITEVVELAEKVTDLKEIQTMLKAIIQSSEEAISVVDENGIGLMINPAYTKITGLHEEEIIGKPATTDISEGESVHYEVLRTRKPVRGRKMKVGPYDKDVLVNVAPIIVDGKLKGSVGVIHDLSEIESLSAELKKAKRIIRNLEAKYTFDDIIADSEDMRLTLEQAKIGAKMPTSILLRGEPGTGKELLAHAIHNESRRKFDNFIRVNCGLVDDDTLQKELFGDELGPPERQKGLFEEASNGSVFLDDIGEMSLTMQGKLLKVLEDQEVVRFGGHERIPVDVRIIAATSVNLERAIVNGSFKESLFYRLNRLPIHLPPLRERMDDLKPLTKHLMNHLNESYGRKINNISEAALDKLRNYSFPGNVRELENILAQAFIKMHPHEREIEEHHIPRLHKHTFDQLDLFHDQREEEFATLQEAMDDFEKQFILEILEANDYIKSKTAKQLNISIRNLYYKMDKYNIGKHINSAEDG